MVSGKPPVGDTLPVGDAPPINVMAVVGDTAVTHDKPPVGERRKCAGR